MTFDVSKVEWFESQEIDSEYHTDERYFLSIFACIFWIFHHF